MNNNRSVRVSVLLQAEVRLTVEGNISQLENVSSNLLAMHVHFFSNTITVAILMTFNQGINFNIT